MGRFVRFPTGGHGLWIDSGKIESVRSACEARGEGGWWWWGGDVKLKAFAHFTKVSDELLRGVDNLQQLLEELVGKALLHGGRVVLQVLQTSATWNDALRGKVAEKET